MSNNQNDKDEEEKIWKKIKEKSREIEYGSLIITIHDKKIVQMETSSKQRFF